jgi:hypothetical protein
MRNRVGSPPFHSSSRCFPVEAFHDFAASEEDLQPDGDQTEKTVDSFRLNTGERSFVAPIPAAVPTVRETKPLGSACRHI